MKILVFDNYDSFTYNLVHIVEAILDADVDVFRNDEITIEAASEYDKIILSPGPGVPKEAGILVPLIKALAPTKDILGVCLGQQAMAEAFGGSLINLENVFHGVATPCNILKPNHYLFKNLPNVIEVGRYHSWVVNEKDLPKNFEIIANDDNGMIMAIQHKEYKLTGVQFHPESVLTPTGKIMMENWIKN